MIWQLNSWPPLIWNVCFCSSILFILRAIFLFFFSQEHAFETSQKYKEGKFIIELAHMIKDNGWE